MRTEILNLLNKGKELHQELVVNYSKLLPENIIQGANRTIEVDIPSKANAILTILNMAEQKEEYPAIDTIDDAITTFMNENIQNSIEKAITDTELVGFSTLKNEKLSASDILTNAKFGVESGVQLISMQITAGKLTKNNGLLQ